MNAKHAAQIAAHKAAIAKKKAQEAARIEEHNQRMANRNKEGYCGYCGRELDYWDNQSGFCSSECEERYGECPCCGAPSRNNVICWDCR